MNFSHSLKPIKILWVENSPVNLWLSKNWREALAEIRPEPALMRIPMMSLRPFSAEADRLKSNNMQANDDRIKPVGLDNFVKAVRVSPNVCFRLVTWPPTESE